MEDQLLFLSMAIILLLGGICSIVFKRFKMPVVIGYLVSGILLAATNLRTQEIGEIVEFLSAIGLSLMMFCIGMELNLTKLRKIGSFAILVVLIQVPIILVGGIVLGGTILGLSSLQQLIFGAIISGSSTAVVTIVLADAKTMSHSDIEVLILVTVVEDVFQVIILSAISPLMTGSNPEISELVWMFISIIAFMVTQIVIGIALFPRFLDWLNKKMPSEVLLIIAMGACFGLAYLATLIGLSVAIGAFLAGVIVSQAKSAKIVEENVTPMRDVFMMMFFVSIGMEISIEGILNNLWAILIIYLIYFVLKSCSVILAYFVGNKPMSLAYNSSIALVAMGEFAFIISKQALDHGIIDNDFYTQVIGAALVSMIVLPVLNKQNQKVINAFALKSPKFIQNFYHKLDVKRGVFSSRISSLSKNAEKSFKTGLATIYANVVLIVIIQVVFAIIGEELIQYVDAFTPPEWTHYTSSVLILLLNFLILTPPLYFVARYFRRVARLIIDADRRATAALEENIVVSNDQEDILQTPVSKKGFNVRIFQKFVKVNPWLVSNILNFFILMITPNGVDIVGHIAVLIAGLILISISFLYSYVRRS